MRLTLATLTLVALAAAPAVAQPTSPHEATATAAFERGDIDTAIREFKAAYRDTRRPDLLYVIGKLHARTDCHLALPYFQDFLRTKPGPKAREAAEVEIQKCLAGPAEPPRDAPDPIEPADTGATTASGDLQLSTVPPAAETAPTSPPRRDMLGLALISGGLALDIGALVLYRQALATQCEAVCTGISYDEYLDKEARARSLRTVAVAVGVAGTAAIGVGVYRYLTRRANHVEVAVVPQAGGGSFTVAGRF